MLVYDPTDAEANLALDWHGGQGSMLYAIASTGALTAGGCRPIRMSGGVWRDTTNDEWKLKLLMDLSQELYDVCVALSHDQSDDDDYNTAEGWATKVDAMIVGLEDAGVGY